MVEDYYEILGVDEDATREEIRSAYRRLAKECHPDCAEVGSEPFRRVHQAYEVLSDPARRRVYDREQAGSRFTVPVRRATRATPVRSNPSPVEPLGARPYSNYGRRPSLLDRFFSDPFDSVLDGLWGGFGTSIPAAPPKVEMEMHLSSAQASAGGTFRVQIIAPAICPTCYGGGWTGPYRCRRCDGTGAAMVERPLTVSYPAGIRDGDTGRMSLGGVGLPASDLVVHFRVRTL